MKKKKKPRIIIVVPGKWIYFLLRERKRKEKKAHETLFAYFSHKQTINILGEQTRHSIVQLQKKIKEMVPKQGRTIINNSSSFFY